MSKKSVTYIDAAKFESLIAASGLTFTLKAGWVKVQGPAGRAVYVPRTKTVGRVDISVGEVLPLEGVMDLGELKFGSVHCGLDMARTEDEILAAFAAVLEHLKTMTPRAIVRKRAPKGDANAKGWSFMAASSPQPAAQSPADAE